MASSSGRRDGDPNSMLGSLSRFWKKSYASDYFGFGVLMTGYLVINIFVEPFHRMFSLDDLHIAFPHAEVERVPLSLDFVYALFIPLGILLAHNRLTSASWHKHHVSVLGIAISMILTAFITDVVKNAVGRPRPDLLARCKPAPSAPHGVLVTVDVCTETRHHVLHDGWRSFPSGHSSFSFAGLGYLSLFLAGQLRIFAHGAGESGSSNSGAGGVRGRSPPPTLGEQTEKLVRGDLLRALLCLSPLLGATMIAISRLQDYRHDVYDVCVGSLLGWVVAYWSYRRYWPRLGHSRPEEPYAGPPSSSDIPYARVRDEEEGRGPNVGYEMYALNSRTY